MLAERSRGGARRPGPERPRRAPRPRPGRGRGRPDGLCQPGRRAGAERRAHVGARRGLARDRLRLDVDRQCGSSMQAAFNAASAMQAGHLDVVVAAGVESMSRVPMGSNLAANGFSGFSPKLYERWEVVPQGISAEVIADEVGALAREPRRVLATSRIGERSRRSTRAGSSARSCRSRWALRARRCSSGSTRTRGARRRSRSSPRSRRRSKRMARSPPGTRARSSTARRRCSSRARRQSAGSGSSRGRGSSRSGSPASTRTGCCTATRSRASERSPRPASSWDDMAVIEVNEAFASVVLQFLKDTGLARALGGGRRQPERQRDLARAPARRDRRADHGDARSGAGPTRGALRHRLDVHRAGPGDRRGRRTPLAPLTPRPRQTRPCTRSS